MIECTGREVNEDGSSGRQRKSSCSICLNEVNWDEGQLPVGQFRLGIAHEYRCLLIFQPFSHLGKWASPKDVQHAMTSVSPVSLEVGI